MSLGTERCEMVGLSMMSVSIVVCLTLNTDTSGKQSELKEVKDHPNKQNHFSYQILKVLGIEFISMTLLPPRTTSDQIWRVTLLPPLTTSDQIWRVGINFKWLCSGVLISNGGAPATH